MGKMKSEGAEEFLTFKALSEPRAEPCEVPKKDSTGKLGPPEFHKAKAIA